MPDLTRRRYNERLDCWHIYCGDVAVGCIARCVGNPGAVERWQWSCGFYPGSKPGEDRHGTEPTFEAARAAFEAAWRDYLPKRTEADFQEWRDSAFGPPRNIAALIAASGCRRIGGRAADSCAAAKVLPVAMQVYAEAAMALSLAPGCSRALALAPHARDRASVTTLLALTSAL